MADEQRSRDVALLREVARAVGSAPDLSSAFDAFVDLLRQRVPFDRANIAVVEDATLVVAARSGPAKGAIPIGTPVGRETPLMRTLLDGNAVLVTDTSTLDGTESVRARGVASAISVPIVVQSDVQAVVSFVAAEVNAFTDADLEFFEDAVRESAGVLNTLYLLGHERELTSKLRDLDQMKNTFVGIVAHDLRSPMQVIAGFAETMRSHWDELADTEKLEYLSIISRNITNLSQLVDDVLQVARIESGELEYRVEPFDLGRLVLRTVDDLTADGARRCVVDVPAKLPMAVGDERRQWQVLTNLIGNAFKFSDPSAPVEVRVALRKSNGSAMLEVSVRDSGIGIGKEDVSRVFDRFSRLAPPAGAPSAKGSGLGLYICKMMVEAQGGSITVESKPSVGSTFRYTVPTSSG